MIDPGFVEREEGNIYRTKIFPIPAKGTKAVRLTYCEALDPDGAHLTYRLPLPTKLVHKIDFTLEHAGEKKLTFPPDEKFGFSKSAEGKYQATARDFLLPPELVVWVEEPEEENLILTKDIMYLRTKSVGGAVRLVPNDCKAIYPAAAVCESLRTRGRRNQSQWQKNRRPSPTLSKTARPFSQMTISPDTKRPLFSGSPARIKRARF